jgi:cell division protein FtsZ
MAHDERTRGTRGHPHGKGGSGAAGSGGSDRERPALLELGPADEQTSDLLEFEDRTRLQASIKVIGVGGGGSNALNTMMRAGLEGVDFVVANTDAQALQHSRAPVKIQLGPEVTRGLGCGANPEKGRAAALEGRDRLRELLTGTDMVFVTAGLGGGTGTGAAPIVAEIAREIGALTVAVVTKPFQFEGKVRSRHAEKGLEELHRVVDTLITIPNHRLLALAGKSASVKDAFRLADDVLYNAVKGISDLITVHGLINLDFADVRTIMSEMGMALMGTGIGRGDARAADAARSAISSPLLEDLSIEGARGVLINITGGSDMTLYEVNEAATLVQEAAHEDANIIFGAVVDERMGEGELRVTVIATGLDDGRMRRDPGRDRDFDSAELSNVTPLRREAARGSEGAPAAQQSPLFEEPPAAPLVAEPEPLRAAAPAPTASDAEELARPEDFMSPFEDEMDVPAFLRRKNERTRRLVEEEDIEEPAFLRRSAD